MASYNPHSPASGNATLYLPSASGAGDSGDGGGMGILGKSLLFAPKFAANFATDVGDAAIGFGPGLYKMVTDPYDAFPAIAKGVVHDWEPLFTGHPVEFAENFYNHPLGPTLDVAALFTGGAAAAGRVARTVSAAEYATRPGSAVVRAGVEAGAKEIAMPAKVPGGFQKLIDNPTPVDRLAAFSRNARQTSLSFRLDDPESRFRITTDAEARRPIPYAQKSGVASRFRQEQYEKLVDNLSTRGGTMGTVGDFLKQGQYEKAALTRLAGSAAALQYQMGTLHRILEKHYDAANGQVRFHALKDTALEWWQRAQDYSAATNRVIPLDEAIAGKYNLDAYAVQAKRSRVYQSYHVREHGVAYEQKFAQGGVDAVIEQFARMGDRLISKPDNFKDWNIITGDEAKRLGLNPSQKYVALLDKHTMKNYGIDTARSLNMVHRGFLKFTTMWKTALLGYSPRFFINNFAGNGLMYAMAHGGPGGLFGLREAMRHLSKEKGYIQADEGLAQALKGMGSENWMQHYFSDQLGQSFHQTNLPEEVAVRGTVYSNLGYKEGRAFEKGARFIFGKTGKYGEQLYRRAIIAKQVRADSRVAAEIERLEKRGMSRKDAFNKAAEKMLQKHPDLRIQITREVDEIMGNYVRLNSKEMKFRAVSPFYAWQRHILKNSFTMALDKPIRTAVAAQAGEYGAEWAQEALGGTVPDWMKGYVKLPGKVGDRQLVFPTGGLNPWAQTGDLAQAAESVLPGGNKFRVGETAGSLLNPLLQSGVENLSGTSLLTGQPTAHKPYGPLDNFFNGIGPLGRVAADPIFNLPQFTILQRALLPNTYKEPPLFAKNANEALLAWFGIPIKALNEARARELGQADKTRRERGY